MVTGFEVTSPFALNERLPRIEPFRLILKSCFAMSARVPFDCAIAATATSADCAAYTEYGSGALWSALVNALTNAVPAPFSCEFGRPATETYEPSADVPACCTVAETGVKPSGIMIFVPAGTPALMSLISLPPFSQIRPPRNTPVAPEALILTASASYEDALPSHAVKPAILRPSFFAAFL